MCIRDSHLPDLFLWNILLRLICSGRSFLRFTDRLFQCRVSPFLIGKAQARLFIREGGEGKKEGEGELKKVELCEFLSRVLFSELFLS